MGINILHKETFVDFQRLRGIYEDILYFKIERPLMDNIKRAVDFFAFLLFEDGSGIHIIDRIPHKIGPRQLHILFPGQIHCLELEGKANIHLLFVSSRILKNFGEILRYPRELYKKYPIVGLSDESYKNILIEFKGIEWELVNNERIFEIMYNRLKTIALLADRETCANLNFRLNKSTDAILKKFFTLIYANYRTERRLKFYAERMYISANYLNILAKKHFGIHATYFINKEVITEIKWQLLFSGKTIKEISLIMNFKDLSSFSRYFKRQTGISPRDFLIHHEDFLGELRMTVIP
ncbi:MAG: helix-turn-helix domain-containing protein [Sphingobacterium sp.]|jgi:AraC-like DNA-binding protein|nr:helix-turn-helix domain-containing protein [Sphingobacterium sp.]